MVCKSTKLYWWQIREKQNLDNENYSSGVQKKKKTPQNNECPVMSCKSKKLICRFTNIFRKGQHFGWVSLNYALNLPTA